MLVTEVVIEQMASGPAPSPAPSPAPTDSSEWMSCLKVSLEERC